MAKRRKLIIAVLFLIIFPVVLVFLAKGVFQGPKAQNKTTLPPSGKVSIYVPSKEVWGFLENPNPENAKRYPEWNLGRLRKLTLAQQLLTKEAVELRYAKDIKQIIDRGPVYNSERPLGNRGIKGDYLAYFMLKGCPPCARQTKVIEDIYAHHPKIKVQGFGIGFSDKELGEFRFPVRPDTGVSEAFKINTFPSIVVFNKNNKQYLLSGYTEENKILSLFK